MALCNTVEILACMALVAKTRIRKNRIHLRYTKQLRDIVFISTNYVRNYILLLGIRKSMPSSTGIPFPVYGSCN